MLEPEWPDELKLTDTPREMQEKLKHFMYGVPNLDMVDYIKQSMVLSRNEELPKTVPPMNWAQAVQKAWGKTGKKP